MQKHIAGTASTQEDVQTEARLHPANGTAYKNTHNDLVWKMRSDMNTRPSYRHNQHSCSRSERATVCHWHAHDKPCERCRNCHCMSTRKSISAFARDGKLAHPRIKPIRPITPERPLKVCVQGVAHNEHAQECSWHASSQLWASSDQRQQN